MKDADYDRVLARLIDHTLLKTDARKARDERYALIARDVGYQILSEAAATRKAKRIGMSRWSRWKSKRALVQTGKYRA